MNGAEVLDVGRDALWLTIQLCAPVLLVGLVVGVGIGLFQALTQIQEQTLIYRPQDHRHLHLPSAVPAPDGRPAGQLHDVDRRPHRGHVGPPWSPMPPPIRSGPAG